MDMVFECCTSINWLLHMLILFVAGYILAVRPCDLHLIFMVGTQGRIFVMRTGN
jgi:hypothetical protein